MSEIQVQRQILDLRHQVERISTWDGAGAAGGKQYATFVVAANDSTADGKASADYVCDGTADETEINAALSVATTSGYRRVLLLEGTFNLTAGLTVEADDMLEGQGFGSILKLVSGAPTTTTAITLNDYCKVHNLKVNGNSLSGTKNGIVATSKTGVEISGVWATLFDDNGIYLDECSQSRIVGNYATSNSGSGIILDGGYANTVVGNTTYSNAFGVFLGDNTTGEQNATISGNACYSNSYDIYISVDCRYNTITGNTCRGDVGVLGDFGIFLESSEYNIISDNIVTGHSADGIFLTFANHNRITDNIIVGNSWSTSTDTGVNNAAGINLDESDSNYISGNLIRKTLDGETYIQQYSIWINDSSCNDNVVLSNDIRNGGNTGFTDVGTDTVYRNIPTQSDLTIAAGVVTVSGIGYYKLVPETGTTDDLDTISGAHHGEEITLAVRDSGDTITIKDGTGNFALAGDFAMNTQTDTIKLIYDETHGWLETSRSNNA